MQIFSVQEAKNNLSALLTAVEEGEEIVITRHGKKIARLVHEVDDVDSSRERRQKEALERLRAFQASVAPATPGSTDWKSLRDEGRK